jgi:hypothetical protein
MLPGEFVDADVTDGDRPGVLTETTSGSWRCGFFAFLMPPTGVTSSGQTPNVGGDCQ